MKLIEILTPDFAFKDDRGEIYQITHEKFGQTNAVFTRKNAVRGNFHYHENTDEIFFVISGEAEVTVRLEENEEVGVFKSGDMFRIPKKVRHSFKYNEDTYLVGFYEKCVENGDGTKDIISVN